MEKMPDLSVVVPCYNEEKNIPLLIERFKDSLPHGINTEMILVDNGSTDNSNNVIRQLMKRYAFIKMVHIKKNIGYGFGIWSGLKQARGEYVCWTHADMQTDPADTIRAYQIILKQKTPKNSFIKGIRRNRSLIPTFFAFSMSIFGTIMLRKLLYDIGGHPSLFHRDFLCNIQNPPNDFSFDMCEYYMAKKMNYNIIRIPVLFPERIYGKSHWNTGLKAILRFVKITWDLAFKLKRNKLR